MRRLAVLMVCVVCSCAAVTVAEQVDLSFRLGNGTEFYTYRSVISKTEISGTYESTSKEIREYDYTFEAGDVDPLTRTRDVRVTYDRVYFSVQTDVPVSELTYDSSDAENQADFLKGTLDHVVGLTVVVTVQMDTGEILATDVPAMPGITERRSELSAFVSVAELTATIGDALGCRAGGGDVEVGQEWTYERGIRLRGMNAATPATREVRVAEQTDKGVVLEYTGDVEINTGAYNLAVSDSGLTGRAVWDSASGVLISQREAIHGEMSGERKGEAMIVILKREQEITRR